MKETTKIEWADYTFNPWVGCTKVSPACDHCYAEQWAKRSGMVKWGAGQERVRTSLSNWSLPIKWNKDAEKSGIRFRVFCASLADVFDNDVPNEWREDLFSLIKATPNLDWLLLTKRIGNAKSMLADAMASMNEWYVNWITSDGNIMPNVWIGATICNQQEANRDIPKLLDVPAAKRFLSIEPMLGPIDLTDIVIKHIGSEDHFSALYDPEDDDAENLPYVDWVIVGGESGHHARPMQADWVRSLRDQCKFASVPFLFKQWGEWAPNWLNDNDDQKIEGSEWMDKMGKKSAGRLLDGVLHDAFPN